MTADMEPLTPIAIERKLRWIYNEMTRAQVALGDARDDEIAAKHQFEREYRAAMLAADCPKVTRGGFTTAERDAWVNERCAPAREAYEIAEIRRKAAEDHVRTLFQQVTVAAVLAKSVHQAYGVAGVSS